MKPKTKKLTVTGGFFGNDGHTYLKMSDGSIGHLDCEKCDKDKKGKSTKSDNKKL